MNTASLQKSLAYLRAEIASSAWSQKERLPPVRILARQAQVSAAAMCSALGMLREEGIVTIVKNRGAYLGSSPQADRKDRNHYLEVIFFGGRRLLVLSRLELRLAVFVGLLF